MEQQNNNKKGSDWLLTIIFSIVAFIVYALVMYLLNFNLLSDLKMTILFVLLSICSGFGLMRAYKYGEEFKS